MAVVPAQCPELDVPQGTAGQGPMKIDLPPQAHLVQAEGASMAADSLPAKVKLPGADWDDASTVALTASVVSGLEETMMGTAEEVDFHMRDLHGFMVALSTSMALAEDNFRLSDAEVADAVQAANAMVTELVMQAHLVAQALLSCDLAKFAVLPVIAQEDPMANMRLQDAEQRLISLRKETFEVRSTYIQVLNRMQYLATCAEVAECLCEESSGRAADVAMGLGQGHLRAIIDLLEDPSPFWLMLHVVELQLEDMEEGVQCLALGIV